MKRSPLVVFCQCFMAAFHIFTWGRSFKPPPWTGWIPVSQFQRESSLVKKMCNYKGCDGDKGEFQKFCTTCIQSFCCSPSALLPSALLLLNFWYILLMFNQNAWKIFVFLIDLHFFNSILKKKKSNVKKKKPKNKQRKTSM